MIFSKILQSIVLVPVSLFPVGRTTSHDVILCAKLWYISIVLCVCVCACAFKSNVVTILSP